MEFGIIIQAYNPAFRRGSDPVAAEHDVLLKDIEVTKAADAAGFKYVWLTEHHFLDEYSHLSANEVVAGYLAAVTKRVHIGSGIFNPLPQVNHPVKVAEKVAMLDHLTEGRFEFGTGRGAGSHEILAFLPGVEDLNATKAIWEDVIAEFPKMWLQEEYPGYEGRFWTLPPRKVLPKPYKPPHPAMWYAAGNTSSYEMAARKGLGVLGFSVQAYDQMAAVVDAYKRAIGDAEPIGAFVNDNVMITTQAFVAEDSKEAAAMYVRSRPNYQVSNVFRYHDTFPHPPGIPKWPDLLPDPKPEMAELMTATGAGLIGTPETALESSRRWEAAGADQLVLGIGPASLEDTLTTIRLFGEHIIPVLDKDSIHSTDRYREEAAG